MVGPEASASGVLSGTSETSSDTCCAPEGGNGQPSALDGGKMLADGVDLGDGRAGVHQRPVGGDQIFQRNFIVDRLFRDRGPSATEHEDHQRRRILGAQRFQHGLGGADRFLVRRRMASAKVAKAPSLRKRIDGTGHDAFEAVARLHLERIDHGMRRFADGDHQHAVV